MRNPLRAVSPRLVALVLALAAAGGASGCMTGVDNSPRPSRMESEGGNAQTVAPGGRTANPLIVQVFDQNLNVMQGQTVKWAVVSGGGTVDSPVTTTNAEGLASTHYTAGPNTGNVQISATLDGLGSITFTIIVAAAPPA